MNIDDFVNKANQIISATESESTELRTDSRIKPEITVRRVRDYLNKGILEKPERVGKNLDFSEKHIEQLLAIRALQAQGLSDKTLTRSNITSTPDSLSYGKSYYESSSSLMTSEPQSSNPASHLFETFDSTATSVVAPNSFESYSANALSSNGPKSLIAQMSHDKSLLNVPTTITTWPPQDSNTPDLFVDMSHTLPEELNGVSQAKSAADLFKQYKNELNQNISTTSATGRISASPTVGQIATSLSSPHKYAPQEQLQKSITGALSEKLLVSKSAKNLRQTTGELGALQNKSPNIFASPVFGRHTLGQGSVDVYVNETALSQLTELDKTNMLEDFQKIIFKKT